jgi:hypothetical protein
VSASKWAPAPYTTLDIGAGTSFHTYLLDANGRKIGVAWGPREEKVWTAALWAAAPEILNALVSLVNRHVRLVSSGDCGSWDVEKEYEIIEARAAIAKATGETQ